MKSEISFTFEELIFLLRRSQHTDVLLILESEEEAAAARKIFKEFVIEGIGMECAEIGRSIITTQTVPKNRVAFSGPKVYKHLKKKKYKGEVYVKYNWLELCKEPEKSPVPIPLEIVIRIDRAVFNGADKIILELGSDD